MKTRLLLTTMLISIVILAISFSAFSQPAYKDRLGGVRDLVNSNELIMVWSQGPNQSSQFCYQRIYDLNLLQPGGPDSALIKKPIYIDSTISGNYSLAVASGNFLGGSFKHFVAAWESPNNSVTVSIPEIESGTLSWTNSNIISLTGYRSNGITNIHVETGNFFGNRQD